MENPEEILKMIPAEVLQRIYKDAASKPLVEVSNLGTDIIKTGRLLLAPLQITAALQDRFSRFIREKVSKIPEEQLVPPPVMIIGPSLEKMKYIEEESPLWKMFEELLLKSVNKDEIDKAHPSFVHIIGQLSYDEAILLYELSKYEFEITDTMDLDRKINKFTNRKVEKSTIPIEKLHYSENDNLYYNHLNSLSLVNWPVIEERSIGSGANQTGTRRYSKWVLTDFGKLFVDACIPKDGFDIVNK
ncbi:MAG: DUF4393 domain-containing protein [Spirochaetota bacterium]|nr:DUF4393 domain-containing protein [Spirochaetota bacterium]